MEMKEIQKSIFSYLALNDKINVMLVCKDFYESIGNAQITVKKFEEFIEENYSNYKCYYEEDRKHHFISSNDYEIIYKKIFSLYAIDYQSYDENSSTVVRHLPSDAMDYKEMQSSYLIHRKIYDKKFFKCKDILAIIKNYEFRENNKKEQTDQKKLSEFVKKKFTPCRISLLFICLFLFFGSIASTALSYTGVLGIGIGSFGKFTFPMFDALFLLFVFLIYAEARYPCLGGQSYDNYLSVKYQDLVYNSPFKNLSQDLGFEDEYSGVITEKSRNFTNQIGYKTLFKHHRFDGKLLDSDDETESEVLSNNQETIKAL